MTTTKPRSKKAATTKKSGSANKETIKARKTEIQESVALEQRIEMIRKAAYFKAEQRGFVGGDPEQDWLDAETEVDEFISS